MATGITASVVGGAIPDPGDMLALQNSANSTKLRTHRGGGLPQRL